MAEHKPAHQRAAEAIDAAHEHAKRVPRHDIEGTRKANERVADAVAYERECRSGLHLGHHQ